MSAVDTQQDIFNDYSALLHAMLPAAHGFLFHDRKTRFYRKDEISAALTPSKEYQIALVQTLNHGELLGEFDHLRVDGYTAYLFQICGDANRALGVVTALVNEDLSSKPHCWIHTQIKPALDSLGRELGLRYKLVKTHRKYQESSADHQFLRQLGEVSRTENTCEDALLTILNTTAEHLELEGISLLVPGRDIALDSGKVVIDPREGVMVIEDQSNHHLESSQTEAREFKASAAGTFTCTILEGKRHPAGLLAVAPKDAANIEERLQDIAEPLASMIEFVIERDFDILTGVPRWGVFEKQLTTAYENNDGCYVLMYFDIDRMQLANETFGRILGDTILRGFGKLLKTHFSGVPMARISSNYFVALLHNVDTHDAVERGKEICQALESQQHDINGRSFKATVSIGLAPLIPCDEGINGALSPAQVACEAAKDRGRGRVEVYESADESIVQRLDNIQMIGSVKAALDEGRMELFAQPLAHLHDASLPTKYEVLLRIRTESGELIEPGQFLAAAERFQIMPDIDRWVVEQTLESIKNHQDHIAPGTLFAINLSGQSLGNPEFNSFLRELLNESSVDPATLCFEITETVAVGNHRQAQVFMREFRALGCHFSLDDFGTGLSSFAYLKLFPVTSIKIDGAFISDIEDNEVSRSMVAAIAQIAKSLELDTVAEFVASTQTVELLRAMGIDWAQGHYVGKPRSIDTYLQATGAHPVTDCTKINTTDANSILTAKLLPDFVHDDFAAEPL